VFGWILIYIFRSVSSSQIDLQSRNNIQFQKQEAMLSEVGKMTYTLERKVKKDFSYKNTSEESFNFLKMR